MEQIIEIIVEMFGEIFVDSAFDIVGNSKYPAWVRITSVFIISVFFAAVIGFISFSAIYAFAEINFIAGIILLAIDLIFTVFAVKKLIKIIRK